MDTKISRAFDLAKERLAQLNALEAKIKQLSAQQNSLAAKELGLKDSLLKENADVEKVETNNITTVFYTVTGTLDEHVEKERSEAFAAKQKYEQVLKDIEIIKNEILKIHTEQLVFADTKQKYDELFAQKKDEILQENGETAKKILVLSESARQATINLEKINAAFDTATMVFDLINTIINSINKAIGFGVMNTVYTDFLTTPHVEENMKEIDNNETLLCQLKTQLDEVHINSDFIISREGTATFAFKKLYNPRFLADWGATSRITESKKVQEGVLRVKARLWDILEALKKMSAKVAVDLERYVADMYTLIIES